MIADASRAIKDSEAELCKENGVNYLEVQVGIDALSVVVQHQIHGHLSYSGRINLNLDC